MAERKEKIVIVRETTISSVLQDIFTFGLLVGSFWFNYQFIGGNDALDILLFFMFFFMGLGQLRNYKYFLEQINSKKAK